jgi:hypothetical protein
MMRCFQRNQFEEIIMKTVVLVLSLAVSGIGISAAYTSAQAGRMNGKGMGCSTGTNCMQDRYNAATKKTNAAKPKKSGM